MFTSLQGRSAVVTGGSKGIGRGIAETFAAAGVDVVITGRNQGDVDTAVAELAGTPGTVTGVAADVASPDDCRRVVAAAVERHGGLDIVCANAGIFQTSPSLDLDDADWQETIDINLTGVWNTVKVALPHLIANKGGSIVLTSSVAGLKAIPNAIHYGAAKHGVIGIMRTVAVEFAQHGIRANSVHPTSVNTIMVQNESVWGLFDPANPHPTRESAEAVFITTNTLPVPWVEPVDISNAVLFLASDEARYITGVTLPVDAGSMLK
jgi:NAD(P)-dependent dehydrogenase (short-subunit alcohol dehydrogenase family)